MHIAFMHAWICSVDHVVQCIYMFIHYIMMHSIYMYWLSKGQYGKITYMYWSGLQMKDSYRSKDSLVRHSLVLTVFVPRPVS